MSRHPVSRIALAATLAVAVLAPVTACADPPVSPLPAAQPSNPSDGSPSAPTVVPPAPSRTPVKVETTRADRPAPPKTTRTGTAPKPAPSESERPSTCLGAVRYDLDVATEELALIRSLCFATGGVLRIQNIGPGEVTVDRTDLVSQHYEAGVVDIRFVRTGTVAVRIPQEGTTHTITVVIR
ncbi:hypothetical protein [Micromonospora echinofusca]|uniref:Uncharacterized protein n=1 Tax=Micromonospora echinofusca TaxID=47858 RepID=A0ABS3VT75_MICEH|nr:hypothetical protein [Micromonospora echinofusca]MBO4207757.1 hypothetical protein [Micromonospora echinofusca]